MAKKSVVLAFCVAMAFLVRGETIKQDELKISAESEVTVLAGDTLRIEYIYGDAKILKKKGAGRLEIAVIGNPGISFIVEEGTLATVRPERMELGDDKGILYHVDATVASSMTCEEINGTNFVLELRDSSGRTIIKSVPHPTRPRPYITAAGMNGLPVVDFGTLKNSSTSASKAYGASMNWEWAPECIAKTNVVEYFFAWEDDSNAKNYKGDYRGASIFGVPSSGWIMTRDISGNGLTASMHPTGGADRRKNNNYLDGILRPAFYRIPDGPHVFNQYSTAAAPYFGIFGFGFNTSSSSYGGFKLGEFIISEKPLSADLRARIQRYLITRWLGAQFSYLTVKPGATLDASGNGVVTDNLSVEPGASVTGEENIDIRYVHAGCAARRVSGPKIVLSDRLGGVQENLSFAGDAVVESLPGTTGAVARVEGTGTLTKTGGGTVLLGSTEGGINAIDVRDGTLRISPLEAPGALMRLDASDAASMDVVESGGRRTVGRWNDANGRTEWYATTNTLKYSFGEKKPVGKPYLVPNALNGRSVVDFGSYTTADFPDGDGGVLSLGSSGFTSLSGVSHIQNFFLVWRDRPETKDLALSGRPIMGPSFFGNGTTWYRGFGGKGKLYPVHYYDAPTRVSNSILLDGESHYYRNAPKTDGWHLMDSWVSYQEGLLVSILGGHQYAQLKNNRNYLNHEPDLSADVKTPSTEGIYGGVQIAEIIFFGRDLTDAYRKAVSGALGAKWFGRDNVRDFESVSLADGTALEMPYSQLCVTNLSFEGDVVFDGGLVLPDGAAVSVRGNATDGFGALKAQSVEAIGSGIVLLTADSSGSYIGKSFRLFDTDLASGDFSRRQWKVKGLPDGVRGTLAVRDGGIWLDFDGCGTVVTLR